MMKLDGTVVPEPDSEDEDDRRRREKKNSSSPNPAKTPRNIVPSRPGAQSKRVVPSARRDGYEQEIQDERGPPPGRGSRAKRSGNEEYAQTENTEHAPRLMPAGRRGDERHAQTEDTDHVPRFMPAGQHGEDQFAKRRRRPKWVLPSRSYQLPASSESQGDDEEIAPRRRPMYKPDGLPAGRGGEYLSPGQPSARRRDLPRRPSPPANIPLPPSDWRGSPGRFAGNEGPERGEMARSDDILSPLHSPRNVHPQRQEPAQESVFEYAQNQGLKHEPNNLEPGSQKFPREAHKVVEGKIVFVYAEAQLKAIEFLRAACNDLTHNWALWLQKPSQPFWKLQQNISSNIFKILKNWLMCDPGIETTIWAKITNNDQALKDIMYYYEQKTITDRQKYYRSLYYLSHENSAAFLPSAVVALNDYRFSQIQEWEFYQVMLDTGLNHERPVRQRERREIFGDGKKSVPDAGVDFAFAADEKKTSDNSGEKGGSFNSRRSEEAAENSEFSRGRDSSQNQLSPTSFYKDQSPVVDVEQFDFDQNVEPRKAERRFRSKSPMSRIDENDEKRDGSEDRFSTDSDVISNEKFDELELKGMIELSQKELAADALLRDEGIREVDSLDPNTNTVYFVDAVRKLLKTWKTYLNKQMNHLDLLRKLYQISNTGKDQFFEFLKQAELDFDSKSDSLDRKILSVEQDLDILSVSTEALELFFEQDQLFLDTAKYFPNRPPVHTDGYMEQRINMLRGSPSLYKAWLRARAGEADAPSSGLPDESRHAPGKTAASTAGYPRVSAAAAGAGDFGADGAAVL